MPVSAPIYDPGQAITCRATGAAVVGARFVKPTGAKVNGGNIPVAYAGSGEATIGVTQRDKPQDEVVTVYGSGHVTHATAGAVIAPGKALKLASGGKVVETTAGGTDKVATSIEGASGDGVLILVQVQL